MRLVRIGVDGAELGVCDGRAGGGRAVVCAAPAPADGERLDWPLRPRPAVVRMFDAPAPDWHRGHRGVDLAGIPVSRCTPPAAGTVVFAGELAGRPVVSIAHPGGLRTSYEPVVPSVRAGQRVAAGAVLGELQAGHAGCAAPACLHWGAMWGPAASARTTSIRSGSSRAHRSASSRCTADCRTASVRVANDIADYLRDR